MFLEGWLISYQSPLLFLPAAPTVSIVVQNNIKPGIITTNKEECFSQQVSRGNDAGLVIKR